MRNVMYPTGAVVLATKRITYERRRRRKMDG